MLFLEQVARYDVIVVGLGAMGSATVYHLARRGQRVLGLDAFAPGHTHGSSHGESRIIRLAYYEHPNYVPLLRRAYQLWESTQAEFGRPLMRLIGGLFLGVADSPLVGGSLLSARTHDLRHELLDADEIRRRYPVLEPRANEVAVYEPTAGVLFPERCIEAHLRLAAAELHFEEPVTSWTASSGGVEVYTSKQRYVADRLVLTAGAWSGKLLADLGLPLQPERIPVVWFEPRETPELFGPDRLAIYVWDTGEAGVFYGCPHLDWPGVKVGRHYQGQACDPDTVDRQATEADERPMRSFVDQRIPALNGPTARRLVCLYTNTPDEHFVVDRHPTLPNVVFAAGFSGHGFKFASVMGEILADLATTGRATPDADFLRAARLSGPRTAGAASH
jgi:sarcosine oxidase